MKSTPGESSCGGFSLLGRPIVLVTLLLGVMVPANASERTHLVKRGETLYGVAKKHKISPAELAERNGLKPTGWLLAGQKLTIPSGAPTSKEPSAPELPAGVAGAIKSARIEPSRWKRIVIHHSGTNEGSAKGMDEYHRVRRRMEHGLAYHFVIGNGRGMDDGEIFVGRRWKEQINGGHLASDAQNETSLGICLVGNFDQGTPTARQMKSLGALIEALQKRCKLDDKAIVTHKDINVVHTRCPGKRFPIDSLLREIRRSAS